ncbi:MAG: hypothetical protein ABJB40_08445 [Acidobacteriota bacterium]
MKKLILILILSLVALQTVMAQPPKFADPKDVGSLDSIMKAIYDVISGDPMIAWRAILGQSFYKCNMALSRLRMKGTLSISIH